MGFLTNLKTSIEALSLNSATSTTAVKWNEMSIEQQDNECNKLVAEHESLIVALIPAIQNAKENRDGSKTLTFESKSFQFSSIQLAALKRILNEVFPTLVFIDNTATGLICKFAKNRISGLSI